MKFKILIVFICFTYFGFAQDDLLSEIDVESESSTTVSSVFKGLKIINFESTKLVGKGGFYFVVSHRFGSVKNGFENLFGLDEAVTHLNFIYGLTEGINLSASRSSNQKIYELASKFRIIKQSERFPFSVVGYTSVLANTALSTDNLPKLEFKHRLSYVAQLLISRKVNNKLSLQFTPTFFHDNYVVNDLQDNSQYGLIFGGRYKIENAGLSIWSMVLILTAPKIRSITTLYP